MSETNVYSLSVNSLEGKPVPLSEYRGQVSLVVNVASECGYTPQYAGLQRIYEKYKGRGFSVLGFPSNDFGKQEPGSSEEIREFCSTKYRVTFPMFEKVQTKPIGDHNPLVGHKFGADPHHLVYNGRLYIYSTDDTQQYELNSKDENGLPTQSNGYGGITRLNVYAGEAAGYVLTDAVEQDMINGTNISGVNAGGLKVLPGIGIPLVIQDRMFAPNAAGTGLDLFYPPAPWVPEFFGDTMCVNGAVEPFLQIEPRLYRFRIINGCNARFLNLNFSGGTLTGVRPPMYVIGSDGGFVPRMAATSASLASGAGTVPLAGRVSGSSVAAGAWATGTSRRAGRQPGSPPTMTARADGSISKRAGVVASGRESPWTIIGTSVMISTVEALNVLTFGL